jgi:hypothetical protein
MIKAGIDTDVYFGGGVRVGPRKCSLELDSILLVDVKIISAQLEGNGWGPSE